MKFVPTPLEGSYVIEPTPHTDNRGYFSRVYCKNEFAEIGHTKEWVQVNYSVTLKAGSLRGMHYQKEPHSEIKLIKCVAGAVYDVIVDLRKDSATYLHWFGVQLSRQNGKMIYIPQGFAHGFQALSDNAELLYFHSEFYAPGAEGAIRYNDPKVEIKWPLPVSEMSERDKSHPLI